MWRRNRHPIIMVSGVACCKGTLVITLIIYSIKQNYEKEWGPAMTQPVTLLFQNV